MELTPGELWDRMKEVARPSLSPQTFQTWLSGVRAAALSADELLLEAPSHFHVQWLEDKYGVLLTQAAEHVLGRPLAVAITCSEESSPIPFPSLEADADDPASEARGRTERRRPAPGGPPPPPTHLNERYTFERFVVGANSQLAAAACRAVAEKPARMYNPLFIYGGVGLGKTHLMHAIGNHLLENGTYRRIAYVSSEQFTNELVDSIQSGTMAAFRRRYREMDLLLVDDVHFLEGKERTQEEFFHTFNALYDAQRQIILTSDRPPKDLPGLEARLVSRFEWGLVADIKPPDYETRVAILRKKAADDGLTLDHEVMDFIAHHCTASVRELEGAVIKLLAYSSLTHQELSPEVARTALQGVLNDEPEGPPVTPERIRRIVAARWGTSPEAMSSRRRTQDVTVPRQVAMYVIRELLDLALARIGDHFGGRDHSTVIHSIRKVEDQMEEDPEFRRKVEEAREEILRGP